LLKGHSYFADPIGQREGDIRGNGSERTHLVATCASQVARDQQRARHIAKCRSGSENHEQRAAAATLAKAGC